MTKKTFLLLLGGIVFCSLAVKAVSSISSFNRAVGKKKFAVAMLYEKDKQLRKANPDFYDDIKDAVSLFKRVSSDRRYKYGNVRFIAANLAKNNLDSLPEDMGLSFSNLPAYFVYKDGRLVRSMGKQVRKAEGFLNAEELRQFVDKSIGSDLEDYIDDKRQAERSRPVYVGGYPWYGYYPWYGGLGWRYGYGSGVRFGFGFGW